MKKILFLIIIISFTSGCKKFLDQIPDDKLTTPKDLADLQALLDNYQQINWSEPSIGEASSDDYYLVPSDYNALSTDYSRRTYTWEKDLQQPTYPNAWSAIYEVVFKANTILDNVDKMQDVINIGEWSNVKGQALYHRGKSSFEATQLYCIAYDKTTAQTDLGLPIRVNSDFNEKSVRSNLQSTYDALIADLKTSVALLPKSSLHPLRPNKAAAFGYLARVYLSMREYKLAGLYADSCLQLNSAVMDYNSLVTTATYPVNPFNVEDIMDNRRTTSSSILKAVAKIDSFLYQSYSDNDLRKVIFFQSNNNGTFGFKGSYAGSQSFYCGIATDEMFLIRSECYARDGDKDKALSDLNKLLIKRWKSGTYVPVTATDASDAKQKILSERRKELLMRGLRWMDLKRLNKEGANITLTRKLGNLTYTLPPNDPKYALPIPENVIAISGMPQNPR